MFNSSLCYNFECHHFVIPSSICLQGAFRTFLFAIHLYRIIFYTFHQSKAEYGTGSREYKLEHTQPIIAG